MGAVPSRASHHRTLHPRQHTRDDRTPPPQCFGSVEPIMVAGVCYTVLISQPFKIMSEDRALFHTGNHTGDCVSTVHYITIR